MNNKLGICDDTMVSDERLDESLNCIKVEDESQINNLDKTFRSQPMMSERYVLPDDDFEI
jgi:hypothetical protein